MLLYHRMATNKDPRLILSAILDAWVPIAASAQRLTNRIELEADNADWVTLLEALDDAEIYLRETQKASGGFPEVKLPPVKPSKPSL